MNREISLEKLKDKFYLVENGKLISYSGSFEKLLNKTVHTHDAKIYYNGFLVWVQKP